MSPRSGCLGVYARGSSRGRREGWVSAGARRRRADAQRRRRQWWRSGDIDNGNGNGNGDGCGDGRAAWKPDDERRPAGRGNAIEVRSRDSTQEGDKGGFAEKHDAQGAARRDEVKASLGHGRMVGSDATAQETQMGRLILLRPKCLPVPRASPAGLGGKMGPPTALEHQVPTAVHTLHVTYTLYKPARGGAAFCLRAAVHASPPATRPKLRRGDVHCPSSPISTRDRH